MLKPHPTTQEQIEYAEWRLSKQQRSERAAAASGGGGGGGGSGGGGSGGGGVDGEAVMEDAFAAVARGEAAPHTTPPHA